MTYCLSRTCNKSYKECIRPAGYSVFFVIRNYLSRAPPHLELAHGPPSLTLRKWVRKGAVERLFCMGSGETLQVPTQIQHYVRIVSRAVFVSRATSLIMWVSMLVCVGCGRGVGTFLYLVNQIDIYVIIKG